MIKVMGRSMSIPWPWGEVLSAVQVVWPKAVIAGGALRDLEHERGIKDVDIFVPAITLSAIERLFHDAIKCDLDSASAFGSDVAYHYTFTRYGWLFEVSFRDHDLDDLLDHMDVGLCMIKWDGREVHRAKDYRRDSVNKCLTVLRRTGSEEAHVDRIAKKYPDFSVIDRRSM